MHEYMPILWLIVFVVALLVEANCICLLSIWFAVGALVALVAALLNWPIWLQVLLFTVVSVTLLASLRGVTRKYLKPKLHRTNLDSILGSQGYVTANIDNAAAKGAVKLGAMEWTARSTTGSSIPAGTLVQVDRIEGVKAFVTAVEK
jgi:membrane protein implicated in regulation of membrane protease activity